MTIEDLYLWSLKNNLHKAILWVNDCEGNLVPMVEKDLTTSVHGDTVEVWINPEE